MIENELISIIMPTYNCGQFIAETIESIQVQTYRNWELVIVDDCSEDNTEEIVRRYMSNDSRIRYQCLDVNSGAAIARTEAMRLAVGEYMAFCDSDDLWYEQKLEKQIGFMRENGYAFSCTKYEQISESGQQLGRIVRVKEKANYNRVLLDCPVGNSTVMYDVRKLGKFQVPNIRKRNDDALWLKILKKEKYIYGLDEVLMKYRVRKNSISSNKMQLIKYHWQLYREVEHLNLFRSIFHICYWCFIKVLRIK